MQVRLAVAEDALGPTEEVPPAGAATRSSPTDQSPRLCGADYEIVKVAAHLESTRLLDPVDLQRLEAGGSDQPLEFFAGAVVVGRVEEERPCW